MREIILDTVCRFWRFSTARNGVTTRARHSFQGITGRLDATEPVLTKVVYLLGPLFAMQGPALEFILRGGAEVVSQTPQTLRRAMQLMEKYRDMPMDFADATLVALAEERKTDETTAVWTIQ